MKRALIVAAVAAMMLGGPVTAQIYTSTELAKVNLFRQMDLTTGALTTKISVLSMSPGGSQGNGVYSVIDGGGNQWQVDWNNQPRTAATGDLKPMNDLALSLLIEMNSSKPIGNITQFFDAGSGTGVAQVPREYRIMGSNDLTGAWTDLTGWRDGNNEFVASARSITTAINGSWQYLQIDYVGMSTWALNANGTERDLIYLREITASPMVGSEIGITSGYSLTPVVYSASLEPGAKPLVTHNGVNGGTNPPLDIGWKDQPSNMANGNVLNFLRPTNAMTQTQRDAMLANLADLDEEERDMILNDPNHPDNPDNPRYHTSWFILSLNELHHLAGFSTATYNSAWNDILIQYTDEDIYAPDWDDSKWQFAFEKKSPLTSIGGMLFFFDEETLEPVTIDARYLRVSTTRGNGTICEFELYGVPAPPIPEPATMSLLALGGLALLRRRK